MLKRKPDINTEKGLPQNDRFCNSPFLFSSGKKRSGLSVIRFFCGKACKNPVIYGKQV